ncbi:Tetratricopeptide repeat-containing protein [Parasphingorhabdus marina DSM 22363]|uniref:Tetratricopeptide repeat-containing protein n=1 Tax=Parasphingorhabdus marina DSM 22363 TaxID=1123272 RepID=A0A1N6CM89_9SPHN|nr:tetratricopeptide repeat protein [Parasphingorhabdus marina]SIN59575.1 Tetratricopeptide repeat-containing protein [Parasphingorhabdus marina DSM 22363]
MTRKKRLQGLVLFQIMAAGALSACSAGSDNPVADAEAAMGAQDYLSARIHLMTALREDSRNPETNLLYARTLIELGDGIGAEAALRKLDGQAEFADKVRPLLGKALLLNGKNDAALELVADAGGATAPELQAVHVLALFGLGRDSEAEAALAEALQASPDHAELNWVRGSRALDLGDFDGAAEHADRALQQAPDSMEALLLQGRVALAKADGKAALAAFDRVREIRQDSVMAEYLRGAVLRDMGDGRAARQSFEKVLTASPAHPWATYYLARMDFDAGKSDAAFERILNSQADLAEAPPALRLAGILDMRRGNHEQAIDKLSRYLSQNPADAESVVALSSALSAAGNASEAWQAIAPLADTVTAPVAVLQQAAKLADAAGQDGADYARRAAELKKVADLNAVFRAEQAIIAQDWRTTAEIYDRLLAKPHPQKVMLLNNAAMAQLNLSQGDRAVELAREALALAPDDAMVKDTLGWILLKTRKDPVRALALIREAAAAQPGNIEFRWHLANALAVNGEADEARQIASSLAAQAQGEQQVQIDNLLAWN